MGSGLTDTSLYWSASAAKLTWFDSGSNPYSSDSPKPYSADGCCCCCCVASSFAAVGNV